MKWLSHGSFISAVDRDVGSVDFDTLSNTPGGGQERFFKADQTWLQIPFYPEKRACASDSVPFGGHSRRLKPLHHLSPGFLGAIVGKPMIAASRVYSLAHCTPQPG